MYIVFNSRCFFLRLLKVALFARESEKGNLTIHFSPLPTEASASPKSHSVYGRSRVLQSKLCDFDRQYFHKTMHQRADLQGLQELLTKLRSKIYQIDTFFFNLARNRQLKLSVVSIAYFCLRSSRFPSLKARSCFPSSFATESALYHVSDECLITRNEASCSFSSCCWVKIILDVLPLNLAPAKSSTLSNVFFTSAKNITFIFRLPSGNMKHLTVSFVFIKKWRFRSYITQL